jgi:hypothetical protein
MANRQSAEGAPLPKVALEAHALGDLKRRDQAALDWLAGLSGSIASRAVFPARPVEMSGELLRRPVRPLQILVPEGSFHQFIRR